MNELRFPQFLQHLILFKFYPDFFGWCNYNFQVLMLNVQKDFVKIMIFQIH